MTNRKSDEINKPIIEQPENQWNFSNQEIENIETSRQDIRISEYMDRLIENDLRPFFSETFPTIFNEDLPLKVNFKRSDDTKIYADANGVGIRFEAPIKISDDGDIAGQPATFYETLGNGFEDGNVFTRAIVDKIILVHELAHKYFDDYMKRNNKSKIFFEKAAAMITDMEADEIIPGVKSCQVASDRDKLFSSGELENYGIASDSGEALAKSVEKIFIEKMFADGKLTKDQYDGLIEFEQGGRNERSSSLVTNNPDSVNNRAYDNQVFFRLFSELGEAALIEYLENVDFFGEYKIIRIDPETGKYTERYKELIDNPAKILDAIKDNDTPIGNLVKLLSSDAAKRAGIDVAKYKGG
ncbi:MAG: hypothetical protein LBC95_02600 [Candidatus Nomurabacteria bacterium]|jgi:hypothetical protein|nr:hypothetical protein [Candidatus Nomurabacteria bacterium]